MTEETAPMKLSAEELVATGKIKPKTTGYGAGRFWLYLGKDNIFTVAPDKEQAVRKANEILSLKNTDFIKKRGIIDMPEGNGYIKKYLERIEKATTEERSNILDKVYEDGFEDGAKSEEVEVKEECKRKCISAGTAFALSTKGTPMLFPVNVQGLVEENDLKIPSSELAMKEKASDKVILAWSIKDNHAHIIYEEDGCCRYTHGTPNELISQKLQEVTHRIFGG